MEFMISHAYVMKPHKRYRVWRTSRLVSMWRFRESGLLREGMGVCTPSHIPNPMHLFHLGVSELHTCKKPGDIISKLFS